MVPRASEKLRMGGARERSVARMRQPAGWSTCVGGGSRSKLKHVGWGRAVWELDPTVRLGGQVRCNPGWGRLGTRTCEGLAGGLQRGHEMGVVCEHSGEWSEPEAAECVCGTSVDVVCGSAGWSAGGKETAGWLLRRWVDRAVGECVCDLSRQKCGVEAGIESAIFSRGGSC